MKKNLFGLSKEKINGIIHELGKSNKKKVPSYLSNQMMEWMYKVDGPVSIDKWTNVSQDWRNILRDGFDVDVGKLVRLDKSKEDETVKGLIGFRKGEGLKDFVLVETVAMPSGKDYTVCVSSQVGCSLSCSFCNTGTQKLERNLTTGEILSQYLLMRKQNEKINRIVFMGQGEPLYNYRNVIQAINIFNNHYNFSNKRITVSTSGVAPAIKKLPNVNLAISLHATTDTLRDELVPLNKTFPLATVLKSCEEYAQKSAKTLSFEYVMLDNVNDTFEDAQRLVSIIKGLNAHCSVNLIPFNSWPGTKYQCSPIDRILKFSHYLYHHNIDAPIRFSKGKDINGACGQLNTEQSLTTREQLNTEQF